MLPGCAPHLHPFPPIFPPLDYGSFPSGSAQTSGLRRMTFISFLRLENTYCLKYNSPINLQFKDGIFETGAYGVPSKSQNELVLNILVYFLE